MNNNSSLIGRTVTQVRAEAPVYEHLVGRTSVVVDEFTDEKGQAHVKTNDGIWCPVRLIAAD